MTNNPLNFNKSDNHREALITVVGFLGAGKTTVLKQLTEAFSQENWQPFIILNDYENAYLDAQQFTDQLSSKSIQALNGSCICCSGIHVLREYVNAIPARLNGITLIEANGTTDACSLAGFLGTGLNERFLPPVQISVVDVKNWQKRDEHNELEANQIQLSSLIILTHIDKVSNERLENVIRDIRRFNQTGRIIKLEELDGSLLPTLSPSNNKAGKIDHLKAHWSSCSVDLPELPNRESIISLCDFIPDTILRIKGCVKLTDDVGFTYFERTPDGQVTIRLFNGLPATGTKLLTIGLGSEEALLSESIKKTIKKHGFEAVKA